MKIKIAIAEDNYFLTKSIIERLSFFNDFKLKYNAENGLDLISKLDDDNNVDVILMDIQMPEMDGIKATEIIKNRYPHIKIIMLTIYDDDDHIFTAIKSGADGYLLKEIAPQKLHDSIVEVINGGAALTANIALKTLNLLRNPERTLKKEDLQEVKLTKRESEILVQLSKGLSYKKIAENLIISSNTVRKHIENIYKKLQAHNRIEAINIAQKQNLL